jgi:hypothetical protein
MKMVSYGSVFIISLIIWGCVKEFFPEVHQSPYRVVVNGLITNQPEVYTINLFWSDPIDEKVNMPLSGCDVTVHDDLGHTYVFNESATPGTYNSDITTFQGVAGRTYKLHIDTKNATPKHHSYESLPVEMNPVPPIDSLYYEKIVISEGPVEPEEGCNIYLNTYDPDGICRFFRWDYTETWQIEVMYGMDDSVRFCWVSNNSPNIDVKNTSGLSENHLVRYPIVYISNQTDRLSIRYSIIVNQYSISNNEFYFWDGVSKMTENVGRLYDVIPTSISGNLICIEDPDERVLGYFSVSAKTSKRIFVNEKFSGLENIYNPECFDVPVDEWISKVHTGQNEWWWILSNEWVTLKKWCADCTARGTTTRPDFWEDSDY